MGTSEDSCLFDSFHYVDGLTAYISTTAAHEPELHGIFGYVPNYSIDAASHVFLLIDAALNSYCKHITCQESCQ